MSRLEPGTNSIVHCHGTWNPLDEPFSADGIGMYNVGYGYLGDGSWIQRQKNHQNITYTQTFQGWLLMCYFVFPVNTSQQQEHQS